MNNSKLTPLQIRFVQALPSVHFNLTHAYLKASPKASETTAAREGHRLANNPKISQEIARLNTRNAERASVDIDWLTAELKSSYLSAREKSDITSARMCLDSLAKLHGFLDSHSTLDVKHSGQVSHVLAEASMAQLDFILASSDAELLALQSPVVEID
jgi:hypothetical protein